MNTTRREFLKVGVAGATLGRAGLGMPALQSGKRPNFLFIVTDQQGNDAISAHGCHDVHTPNVDRLVREGVSFRESYTAYPLCSPARSSLFTGRMPSETGVINNGLSIRAGIPNLGQWLGQEGYEPVYSGKWHVPQGFTTTIPGFTVLPGGLTGQGNMGDAGVSRACQGYLLNRSRSKPFALVASFLQPHDICGWVADHMGPAGWEEPPVHAPEFPPLPPNFQFDPREPDFLRKRARPRWSDAQWRFYLWSYYRHVEMVDAEIGRVLTALDASGDRDNTIVIMTSDHGEGRGRHHMVLKNYLYDEASRVPLVLSWPGRIGAGQQDSTHLVSGTDLVPTLCDYAGVKTPARVVGRTLRPLLEGKRTEWRELVAAEVAGGGRMIRTAGHKYVAYPDDPVDQLFDMQGDAGETRNLAPDSAHAAPLESHRKLLKDWTAHLEVAPPEPRRKRKAG